MVLDDNSQKHYLKAHLRKSIALSWKGNFELAEQVLHNLQEDKKI